MDNNQNNQPESITIICPCCETEITLDPLVCICDLCCAIQGLCQCQQCNLFTYCDKETCERGLTETNWVDEIKGDEQS